MTLTASPGGGEAVGGDKNGEEADDPCFEGLTVPFNS